MTGRQRLFAIVGVVVILSGCMTVNMDAKGEIPVSMSGEQVRSYRVVRSFQETDHAWFTLWDLVTFDDAEVRRVVYREVNNAGGDAAINVSIKGETTFVDGLIPIGVGVGTALIVSAINPFAAPYVSSVAAAMLSRRSFTVSGDIIVYEE